jgi:hypothetical protein
MKIAQSLKKADCQADKKSRQQCAHLWKKLWITSANPTQKTRFFLLSTVAGF